MKKIYIFIFLCLILTTRNIVNGQGNNLTENLTIGGDGANTIEGAAGPDSGSLEIISKVSILFCNDGFDKDSLKKIQNIDIKQGEEKDFCIVINNSNSNSVNLIPGFSYGSFGKNGEFLCGDDNKDSAVGNHFKSNRKDGDITINGGEYTILTGKIQLPKNLSGKQNICFHTSLVEDPKFILGGTFKLKHRRGAGLILNISGSIENKTTIEKIKENKRNILKRIIFIISILIIISLLQQFSKKTHTRHHHKK